MAKSRTRKKRSSAKPARAAGSVRRGSRWRGRVGWSICALGLVMFLTGNIGARTGIVILPFDPHHVIGQLGGAIIATVGLMLATAR